MALATTYEANPHWVQPKSENGLDHIPGEDGLPFVGTTLRMLKDPHKFSAEMQAKYGKVYRANSFGGRSVALVGADANELVLFNKEKLFSSEQGWGPVLNLLFPRGLMLMDFDHHRADRKALSIAFKPQPMRAYCSALNDGIQRGIKSWAGQDMQFYPAIKKLTLDLAATSFLGVEWGPEADKVNTAFVDAVQASVGVIRSPLPFTKMRKGVVGRQYLIDYFRPQIAERRRSENRQDMFSQFCRATHDDGTLLSEDEVIDHMNFLMMAAHDTITSSVTSLVYYLAKNPEWQEKVRQECLSVAPAGQPLGYDDLGKLELTEYAIKEALRMKPPVPSLPRAALRDFSFGGYDIPAGTLVGISPNAVHYSEEYWDNPTVFDPMRFSPDQVRTRHKYAWVPFGGGAHMCLGLHFAYMQTKILMYQLLTTQRIEVAEGYEPQWQHFPIPQPKDGLKVRFAKL